MPAPDPTPDTTPVAPAVSPPDPGRWVDDHGDYLFRFALARLRDESRAEDAVQETFLAGLKGGRTFAGRSAERTWLTGILKNKIYDHFRKASRERSFTDLEFYSGEEEDGFNHDGPAAGAWTPDRSPGEWDDPGAGLDQEVFWRAYRGCADKLPRNISAVFQLREVDGLESREVCALLQISEANLWVMLHRARMALRHCLEVNWFDKTR